MTDFLSQIDAVHREVGASGKATRMLMRRSYDGAVEDVWDALTDPDRLRRWFLPVSGDLKVGGNYQLEGNAGGEILACDAPNRLKVTWIYGEPAGLSELEVRLTAESEDRTVLELEHIAEIPAEMWSQFGPGATGIGWDLSLLGLGLHLAGRDLSAEEKAAADQSPEMRECMTRSGHAWADAHRAYGADEAEVASALQGSLGFYVPDLEPKS
ncbi:MAG: SRPBCC family protein [Kribbellaceae bacterium]|nr:SRPBCC family protein [Kribbellaceae bacterium]